MGVLAVIPARAGSRGVPQKALQPVSGVPLLLRTVDTVQAAGVAERIIVTTDCPQIAGFCRLRGIDVIDRPANLAADDVPLRPVIDHAVTHTGWQGVTATFQPTCPLLRPETVRKVIEEFEFRQLHWAITGTPETHLLWKGNQPVTPRVNRQQADGRMIRETGAVQMFNPDGDGQAIIPILPGEALDIDTPADLAAARHAADARTIRLTVAASKRLGSGHYWRSLQIADELTFAGHHVEWEWSTDSCPPMWAHQTLERRGYIKNTLGEPDLQVYDMLDAGRRVLDDRARGTPVVVFEDHGAAADWADLAINEMVDGPKWALLRPEFSCLPAYEPREGASRILVTFGGTDPSGLTDTVRRLFAPIPDVATRVIRPVMDAHMAEEMLNADLVITGQGRTVFEAAACGVPCLSIAANEREARHVRIPGALYLGLHALLTERQIHDTAMRVLGDRALREDMAATSHAQVDGKGLARIMHKIDGLLRGL